VLYLVELDSNKKSDSRVIVIYDNSNETYYYYGTRSRTLGFPQQQFQDKHIEFLGAYHESKLLTFVSFLKHLNNLFDCRFNIEMHNIVLYEGEYETLSFETIFNKFSPYTELFAYDYTKESEGSILEKLDMLTSIIE
jgi:hypothetical protein